MKKLKIIFASCALLGIGSIVIQKFDNPKKPNNEIISSQNISEQIKPAQATESAKNEVKPQPKKSGYKIQEYNGNIAVFENGQDKPFRKTEIAVKNLPEVDRNELKNGIEVETNEELQTLLEDYLS